MCEQNVWVQNAVCLLVENDPVLDSKLSEKDFKKICVKVLPPNMELDGSILEVLTGRRSLQDSYKSKNYHEPSFVDWETLQVHRLNRKCLNS